MPAASGRHFLRSAISNIVPVAERTSTVVWDVLTRIGEPTLLWNAFPLHPHEPTDSFSNRGQTRAERDATWPLTTALIAMVRPRRIVAIGRDAAEALAGIDMVAEVVRHPSHGGQGEFVAGIDTIYGIVEGYSGEEAVVVRNGAQSRRR